MKTGGERKVGERRKGGGGGGAPCGSQTHGVSLSLSLSHLHSTALQKMGESPRHPSLFPDISLIFSALLSTPAPLPDILPLLSNAEQIQRILRNTMLHSTAVVITGMRG